MPIPPAVSSSSSFRVFRGPPLLSLPALAVLFALAAFQTLPAEPLSKKIDLDFFREISSRNLHGLATRSDGRLVPGPVLTELTGPAPADLLWCLAPAAEHKWLIGTGPDGKIFEATLDPAKNSYATREFAKLDESHVFALARLSDGTVIAGTSPNGGLVLLRDGKIVARVGLPVDSIFDILEPAPNLILVATGNPARIYQVTPDTFAKAGVNSAKITDAKLLAEKGVALFGEIRDRNIRRLARLADGRIVAGSSPKGNIYAFPAPTSLNSSSRPSSNGATADQPSTLNSPVILQENHDAEVTAFLPQPNGDLYATLVFTASTGDARINSTPKPPKDTAAKDAPDLSSPSALASLSNLSAAEKFSGRSALVYFPAGGFPETLTARNNAAFYQIARHADTLLLAGGEQGEILGYDLASRLPLTFAGSTSAQLNALAAVPGAPGQFLLLRNNAPGLALLDFNATAERSAETRRFDLGTPATLGALRFTRLRELTASQLTLEIKTSFGSDEVEGWTPWTPLTAPDPADPAWRAPALRARYAKLRLKISSSAPAFELDKAELNFLPQNRRPTLQEFRLLAPNFAILPAAEPAPSVTTSLSQLIATGGKDDEPGSSPKRGKSGFLNSQVVPAPGTQAVLWTIIDPDGDNVTATFSIRREGQAAWTDLTVFSREPYTQFETSHLADGVYFTRIVATEAAPRAPADRLSVTFETDNLIVDHTPPVILEATATRTAERLTISVHGRDALSLLEGLEVTLNNGAHETVEQPADGIRDGREETFTLEVPLAKAAGATNAEVILYDAAGNATTRRLAW